MKLYDLTKGDKIYEQLSSNVGKVFFESNAEEDPIIFDHLDGMYSYCYLQSNPKMVVHISASAPLVPYKDGYKLESEDRNGSDKRNPKDPVKREGGDAVPVSGKQRPKQSQTSVGVGN